MTPTDEDINEAVFAMTAEVFKDYCATRLDEGVSNAQLNHELTMMIPAINQWSRQQRALLKLMMLDAAPSHELH